MNHSNGLFFHWNKSLEFWKFLVVFFARMLGCLDLNFHSIPSIAQFYVNMCSMFVNTRDQKTGWKGMKSPSLKWIRFTWAWIEHWPWGFTLRYPKVGKSTGIVSSRSSADFELYWSILCFACFVQIARNVWWYFEKILISKGYTLLDQSHNVGLVCFREAWWAGMSQNHWT